MVYECEKCGLALPGGVLNCPKCGEGFDEPVPQDAEVSVRGWQPKSEVEGSASATSKPEIKTPATSKIVISQEHHPEPAVPISGIDPKSGHSVSYPSAPVAVPQPKAGKISIWLIIVALIFLPITLLYLVCLAMVKIWKHPTWSVRTKSLLTVVVVAAVVIMPIVGSVQDAQDQATQQKAAIAAQSQQEAAQRAEQKRIAGLQATPQGRSQLGAERKQKQLAAAEQDHQQKLISVRDAKEQPASLIVTALPGRRIQVSGTAGIPNNETVLVTLEQKPSGFSGQSQPLVTNGAFSTEAFGPDGGLTPGFYTIQINYGNTEKESGVELRGDGSIVTTSSKYAIAHAKPPKPRQYGSYPMVNPDNYGSSTAERAMADFLSSWKAHNWNRMLNTTELTWRVDQENPADWLSNMYGIQDIVGAKIDDVEPGSFLGSYSSSVTDIKFTVYYKDTNGDIKELTTVGRVMRENAPRSLSSSGEWGVNPISTLNYGHKSGI